jgi:hypothetical protein
VEHPLGERVFDNKVGERKQPNVFVLVCAALEEINEPRDIVFSRTRYRAAAHR